MPQPLPNDGSLTKRDSVKVRVDTYVDEAGVTRYKLATVREKMDHEAKMTFLKTFAQHGRYGSAARAAGVCMSTVKRAITLDPDFGAAVMEALEIYKDRLIEHHQNLVFNGTQKVNYDRNGNVVSEETIYPIRLIELELKKHDEGYRDKREVNMNVKGGVMVAPSEVNNIDEWEKKFGRRDELGESGAALADIADAEVVSDADEDTSPLGNPREDKDE